MKWNSAIAFLFGLCLAAAPPLLQAAPGQDPDSSASADSNSGGQSIDWVQHTQQMLDELKGKLNLQSSQTSAWDSWSAGAMKDVRQDVNWIENMRKQEKGAAKSPKELTTPEQMQRGIEHMKAHLQWMQDRLSQLQSEQQRTQNFYQQLDTNQKTIFDMFWRQMYHRMAGHDFGPGMQGWGMQEEGSHQGFRPAAGMSPAGHGACC